MPVPEFDQPGLLSPLFARGPVADAVSEDAWLRALIEVEAALARAVGEHERAEAILSSNVTLAEIADETSETASPLVGLVRRLREQAGPEVHVGATSQDIVDTATMLVLRRAVGPLLTDARAAAETCAQLARRHRDDPTIGRTLLQPALATSFGLRAARWMIGIDDAVAWLQSVHQHELVVDFGGPIGHADPALASALADELALGEPILAWHAVRLRPARVASALAALCGILGKVARDVTLLAQPEIGEVREGDASRGRSSSVPGKNNPVAATTVLMCTRRVPPLLATIFAGMEQEHERGAGGWQVEWATLTELLRLAGSATRWARDMLEHLQVDVDRMRRAAGDQPDLGWSGTLVDRALTAHCGQPSSTVAPPSTTRFSPVTNRDSSDTR
jgi:3-carboxy-cis,cis-muconate cycloisomerase